MTVAELIDRLIGAYPGASPEAFATFKPVFYARFKKREGEPLQAAFDATLAEFKPKYGQPFPIPGDFERNMPSGKLDLGRGEGQKLDLDGRKRRADGLFAEWQAGQGTRAAKGNPALRRALEHIAQPLANLLAWDENPEPLVLTRDQLKLACQRAISFERLARYGQPPRDRVRWWEQIAAIAAEWRIDISPEWWDAETAKALADPEGAVSRVERVNAAADPAITASTALNPAMQAALLAAVAERHRVAGRWEYAARLEVTAMEMGFGWPIESAASAPPDAIAE